MTSDPLTVPAAIDKPATKQQLLKLGPTERLRSISTIFLFPQTVRTALEQLEYVFHSRGPGLSANILLTGADQVGKRALIRYFASRHPPVHGDIFDQQPRHQRLAPMPSVLRRPASAGYRHIPRTNMRSFNIAQVSDMMERHHPMGRSNRQTAGVP